MTVSLSDASVKADTAAWSGGYLIGIDTGGTFTDCVVAGPRGLSIGKAPTTPGELWRGILDAIGDATAQIGGMSEILARTDVIAHGTTAMLNAVLTNAGAKVGIITTAGFEDTLRIGRIHQKVAGLAEWEMTDVLKLTKSSLFRDRRMVVGLHERIDASGKVLLRVDADEVKAAALLLAERGATSFAVNLLWSCANPAHEQAVAKIINTVLPGRRVSCSALLSPIVGEYERFATCAVNAYVVDIANDYLDTLKQKLAEQGFAGRLLIARSWGDLERVERVAEGAVASLFSGPIGGVVGARALTGGEIPTILCADVGGTSFDVAVLTRGAAQWNRQPIVERLHLGIPTLDVTSIGTGGGSIASYDPDVGLVHVGPHSSGSRPGPACYGRGGDRPTLTDAALVAGWIPPSAKMPGGISLSRTLAYAAIEHAIAKPAGMSVDQAASAILRIATAQMADLARKACIERAADPRAAVPLIYGGAGGQYAGALCTELGAKRFLVPELASAFSAFGMLGAREGLVLTRAMNQLLPIAEQELAAAFERLEAGVISDMDGDEALAFERFAELRYQQQVNELRLELPPVAAGMDLADIFTGAYEKRFGAGTGNAASPIELTALLVHGSRAISPNRPLTAKALSDVRFDATTKAESRRFVWLDGTAYDVGHETFQGLRAGHVLQGPAVASDSYTSVVIPPHWSARWNAELNMLDVVNDRAASN